MDLTMLKSIPVWEKQRVYRKERAKKIAESYLSKSREPDEAITIPGIIAIYEKGWEEPAAAGAAGTGGTAGAGGALALAGKALSAERQRFGIIDGQHRVGALRVLHNAGQLKDERVLVEVFSLRQEEQVAELFLDINKAEPVKDVDLPGGASTHEREILHSAVTALQFQYPSFFKESTKCRKPNLNADNFRDALFQSRVIERQKIATDEDLVNYLLHKNAELAERTDDEWAASAVGGGKALMNQIKKAREGNFYLGLVSEWD